MASVHVATSDAMPVIPLPLAPTPQFTVSGKIFLTCLFWELGLILMLIRILYTPHYYWVGPKSSMLWKNSKEMFGQPSIYM